MAKYASVNSDISNLPVATAKAVLPPTLANHPDDWHECMNASVARRGLRRSERAEQSPTSANTGRTQKDNSHFLVTYEKQKIVLTVTQNNYQLTQCETHKKWFVRVSDCG